MLMPSASQSQHSDGGIDRVQHRLLVAGVACARGGRAQGRLDHRRLTEEGKLLVRGRADLGACRRAEAQVHSVCE